jgi:hypothetical protein
LHAPFLQSARSKPSPAARVLRETIATRVDVKLDGLKPEEERALNALQYQLDEIDRLKSRRSVEGRATDSTN